MNSKPVVALPEVYGDLENAISHYLTWRADGREHVLGSYDETIDWIAWNPDLFPKRSAASSESSSNGPTSSSTFCRKTPEPWCWRCWMAE